MASSHLAVSKKTVLRSATCKVTASKSYVIDLEEVVEFSPWGLTGSGTVHLSSGPEPCFVEILSSEDPARDRLRCFLEAFKARKHEKKHDVLRQTLLVFRQPVPSQIEEYHICREHQYKVHEKYCECVGGKPTARDEFTRPNDEVWIVNRHVGTSLQTWLASQRCLQQDARSDGEMTLLDLTQQLTASTGNVRTPKSSQFERPSASIIIDRLQRVHKIASSIAYVHKLGAAFLNLSLESFFLDGSGTLRIEHPTTFSSPDAATMNVSVDARFAAPEVLREDLVTIELHKRNEATFPRSLAKVYSTGLAQDLNIARGYSDKAIAQTRRERPISSFSDVYSFGIIAAQLLLPEDPLEDETITLHFRHDVIANKSDRCRSVEKCLLREVQQGTLPWEAAALVIRCLRFDPLQRPSMVAVQNVLDEVIKREQYRVCPSRVSDNIDILVPSLFVQRLIHSEEMKGLAMGQMRSVLLAIGREDLFANAFKFFANPQTLRLWLGPVLKKWNQLRNQAFLELDDEEQVADEEYSARPVADSLCILNEIDATVNALNLAALQKLIAPLCAESSSLLLENASTAQALTPASVRRMTRQLSETLELMNALRGVVTYEHDGRSDDAGDQFHMTIDQENLLKWASHETPRVKRCLQILRDLARDRERPRRIGPRDSPSGTLESPVPPVPYNRSEGRSIQCTIAIVEHGSVPTCCKAVLHPRVGDAAASYIDDMAMWA